MLKIGAGVAAATAMLGAAYWLNGRESWDFLEPRVLPSPSEMEQAYVQPRYRDSMAKLGPTRKLRNGSPEWISLVTGAGPKLNEMVRKGLIDGDPGNYAPVAEAEYLAVPDEPRFTGSVISFGRKAVGFLYSKIKGLDEKYAMFEWVPVEAGEDYSDRCDSSCFIGQGYYEVNTLSIADRNRVEKADFSTIMHVATEPTFSYGAFNSMVRLPGGSGKQAWFFFVPANENGLYAFFSEIIPFSTFPATTKYEQEAGQANANTAEETISEALSANLLREAVNGFDIPYSKRLVGVKVAELARKPVYRHVQEADGWIMRNGIQAAFDMYMESPGKFMKAISAY